MPKRTEGSNNVIIAAGGTGGHIFPALAVWQILSDRCPTLELTWIGTSHRMESTLIPAKGINFIGLRQTEIRRKISPGNIIYNSRSVWFLLAAFIKATGLVRKIRPKFILTTGGFAGGAVGLAAWLTGTPLAIIEPNAYPGLTNRFLGKRARFVFTAYKQAEKYFPLKNAMTTGSPARKEIIDIDTKSARLKLGLDEKMIMILAMGGSQGAKGINDVLPDAMNITVNCAAGINLKVIHQCGKGKVGSIMIDRKTLPESIYEIREFIDDVPTYLGASDIVISRAGASTLSEIACRGVPSILVPYPHSAENHQVINAREWKNSSAAWCIEEKDLTPEILADKIKALISDSKLRISMGEKARQFGNPSAAGNIADKLEELLK
jgi:UDP-N-acetylglucosamine--N-acetylmuramyl-(pentapeptide) pyrophosphoryl-undecaprenol N-acetylglucosamine transferase